MSRKFDYSKIKEHRIYDILRPVGVLVCKLFFKVRYTGQENIPDEGGFILASNHIHALDPLIIALGMKKRQMHFMGKRELFENAFVGKCLTLVNGFPVSRSSSDSAAVSYASKIPEEGYVLGIFPEGTRSKDGNPGKAKRGVADIAFNSKRGILPVCVYNDEGLKKRSKYTVRYGKFIPYEELGMSEEATREEKLECAEAVMSKIVELREEGHCS